LPLQVCQCCLSHCPQAQVSQWRVQAVQGLLLAPCQGEAAAWLLLWEGLVGLWVMATEARVGPPVQNPEVVPLLLLLGVVSLLLQARLGRSG
jgi:hypothetical protein